MARLIVIRYFLHNICVQCIRNKQSIGTIIESFIIYVVKVLLFDWPIAFIHKSIIVAISHYSCNYSSCFMLSANSMVLLVSTYGTMFLLEKHFIKLVLLTTSKGLVK